MDSLRENASSRLLPLTLGLARRCGGGARFCQWTGTSFPSQLTMEPAWTRRAVEAAVKGRVAGLGVLPSGINREFADYFKLAQRRLRRGYNAILLIASLATDILCQGNGPSYLSCLKKRK